jgi:hypothetical protein
MNSNNVKNKALASGATNDADRSKCNLIVNYLPQSLKENEFSQLFAELGPIRTCKLMYDKKTGDYYCPASGLPDPIVNHLSF